MWQKKKKSASTHTHTHSVKLDVRGCNLRSVSWQGALNQKDVKQTG